MSRPDEEGPHTSRRYQTRVDPKQRPEDRVDAHNDLLFGDVRTADRAKLQSETVMVLHDKMISHYLRELDRQSEWRRRMELDEDFYDSDQWDAESKLILAERGQEALVLNVIAQSINWIIGSQRSARTDYKILPRRKDASKAAERKGQLLKYLADVNKSQFAFSDAFEEQIKAGLSWLECGVQDDADGEPIYERYESWRNIVWDSSASERDLSDGRYLFRTKWVDMDTAIALFPNRKDAIQHSASTVHEFGASLDRFGDEAMDSMETDSVREAYSSIEHPAYSRDRVRLIEAWFKIPEQEEVMAGGDFAGEMFDPNSPGHAEQIETGMAEVRKRLTYRTYVMVMTNSRVLWFSKSPYRQNRYPLTPLWCYRKKKTGEPYGIVRNMVDAQKDINKRFSKALAILSSNKTIMDEGAVADLDEFEEEVSRPNAIIVKKKGFQLDIAADRELAPAHLQVLQMSMQMIQTLSGVTDEAMGRTTNAVSGRAITARQEQGAVSTSTAFDHLRAARQYHGEKMLSLVEQFMDERKQFRITNSRGQPDYVEINDGMPDNDIIRTKADFVISEDDWNASIRRAQVTELMEMMTQLAPVAPQIVMVLLDLVVETMDIPSREEIVKRIRGLTGMEDPDADPNSPDPEREAREKQKAQQAAMEARAAEAQIAKLEGEAAKTQAVAEKEAANAAKILMSMPGETIEQKRKALEVAIMLLGGPPGAADTADALLDDAGLGDQPPGPPPGQEMGVEQPMPEPAMDGGMM